MLLIKNGEIINPGGEVRGRADILIRDGRIVRMAATIPEEACDCEPQNGNISETCDRESQEGSRGSAKGEELQVVDASGLMIAPGLIDVHAHFREPGFEYKEDIKTGALAAARGGYTGIVLMANTKPPVDTEEILKLILEKGRETQIHIYSCANVTRGMEGKELTDMDALAAAGAAGFTDDGMPILDEAVMKQAMEKAERLGLPLSLHEENPLLSGRTGFMPERSPFKWDWKGQNGWQKLIW